MNIDKYNEAIRQKLESIEPTFEDSDWTAMQSFMALHTPKASFWGQYGRLFLYSAGTLVLITSLLFNLKQNYVNTSLLNTNKILLEKINAQAPAETKVIYQKDTVYLTKYINSKQSVTTPEIEQSIANDKTVVPIITENKKLKDSISHYSNNEQNKPEQIVEAKGTRVSKKTESRDISKVIESGSIAKQQTAELVKQVDSTINTNHNVQSISNESQSINSVTVNSIQLRQPVYSWNKQAPKIKYHKPFSENSLSQRKRKTLNFPSISFDNLKYRVGISLNAGHEEIGASLLGEVLLNKHWSINAGLKVLNTGSRTYFTAEQFEFENGQDFRQLYAPYVALNNDILNIDFQQYWLQIPIGITYRYPLRNDFALLLSSTVDLNVYGQQVVNFDYKEDNRKFDQGLVHSTISTNLINTIEMSAGLEKKVKRMVFQAYPYISLPLRETNFKREEFVLGAKLRFFVNLYK